MNTSLSPIKYPYFPSLLLSHSWTPLYPHPWSKNTSVVHSKLDYCNSLYYNLSNSQLSRLQHIQNSLARVIAKAHPKFSHTTPILKPLHWLKKINERIEYKILSLTYKNLTTAQPAYLRDVISVHLLTALVCHLSSPLLDACPLSKSQIAHSGKLPASFSQPCSSSVNTITPSMIHHSRSLPFQTLKHTYSTNPFHHRSSPTNRTAHWTPTGLPSRTP